MKIDSETQEERIKMVYPNNYKDHLNNRDHLSEKNEFQWLNDPLIIDTSKETIVDIQQKVFSFIN